MSLISIKRYDLLKHYADDQLKYKLGSSYESMPKEYKDAYLNAYAQNQNLGQNTFDYNTATDKEIQNWAKAKEIRKNNEGDWEQAIFDDLFRPADKPNTYETNPDTTFITEKRDLTPQERDKCLAVLLSSGSDIAKIDEKFKDSFISGIYAIDPLILDLDGNGTKSVLSCN